MLLLITNKFQYNLIFQSQTGNKNDVTINTGLSAIIVTNQAAFTMRNLTLTSAVENLSGLQISNLSKCFMTNCTVFLPTQTTINDYYYISISEKAELQLDNLEFNTALDNKVSLITFNAAMQQQTQIDAYLENLISNKVDTSDIYTKIQLDNNYYNKVYIHVNYYNRLYINETFDNKVNKSDAYTKLSVNNSLNYKQSAILYMRCPKTEQTLRFTL